MIMCYETRFNLKGVYHDETMCLFPWPYSVPIGYNTTTDDATAAFTSVLRTLARADPVNQVHLFTCSCPKEDVDGVNQLFP